MQNCGKPQGLLTLKGERILSRDPAHFLGKRAPRCDGEVLLWLACHSHGLHRPVVLGCDSTPEPEPERNVLDTWSTNGVECSEFLSRSQFRGSLQQGCSLDPIHIWGSTEYLTDRCNR